MKSKEVKSFTNVLENEKFRIAERDKELLALELSWIANQSGLTTPSFYSLDEYCHWLSPKHPEIVKWDLLRHYAAQNDAAYLPVFKRNNVTIRKPYHHDYQDRLLTHSLAYEYWLQAEESGFLPGRPQVCFSSGQAVFKGDVFDGFDSMTVIFDRQVLEQVYILQPYSDHDVEWEREIRAHEPISLGLALGWIPTEDFLRSDLNHWGQLTCVCGKKMMADLESDYLKTGILKEVR